MLARHRLVETGVADFIERSGLDLPVSAQAIAAWIRLVLDRMEAGTAPGVPEEQGHRGEAVAALLRHHEVTGRRPPAAARRRK